MHYSYTTQGSLVRPMHGGLTMQNSFKVKNAKLERIFYKLICQIFLSFFNHFFLIEINTNMNVRPLFASYEIS